jgi:hypothetical protein
MATKEEENYYFYSTIPGGENGLPYSFIVAIGSPTSTLSTGFRVNRGTQLLVGEVPRPINMINTIGIGKRVDVDTDGVYATVIRVHRD